MKSSIIALGLCLGAYSSFAQYGQDYIQHNTSFLTSAKLTVTTYGYVNAGVYPSATGAAASDFIIEQIDPIANSIVFSQEYKVSTCISASPHQCTDVDVIETYVSNPSLSFAFAGICKDGIFFGTLDNLGNLVDQHFWNTGTGALLEHIAIRESSTSGEYFITCRYNNKLFATRYQRGAALPIWEIVYGGNFILDPRDVIEDPTNPNKIAVVGLCDVGGFLADEGFFLQLNSNTGAVLIFNTYSNTSYSGDEWFNRIEPAYSTNGGSAGYVIAARQVSPGGPIQRPGWLIKLDYNGNVVWSSIFSDGEALDVVERYNPFTTPTSYEYFVLTKEDVSGNNTLRLYKFQENGVEFPTSPNRWNYSLGTNGLPAGSTDYTDPQLVISGDGSGLYDGLGIFGTDISTPGALSQQIIGTYFNGKMGCEVNSDFRIVSGPGISSTPNLSSNATNLTCNISISQVSNADPLLQNCPWSNAVAGGSNLRPALTTTGLDLNYKENKTISWSPNPTSGLLTLSNNSNVANLNLKIRNALGQIVFESSNKKIVGERFEIDLTSLNIDSGIYFLETTIDGTTSTNKIIYNK